MAAIREGSDYDLRARDIPVGAQMLFVAFGALVLVPLLTGLLYLDWLQPCLR